MLKIILRKIQKQIEKAEQRKRQERRRKYYEIRGAVIKFYEDKDTANGGPVELPAFKRADDILAKVVRTNKDIDFYYKKLVKYGLANG